MVLAAIVLAIHCTGAPASPITEPQAKASLLFNLAAFVQWPQSALAAGDRLTICVAGDPDVLAALRQYEGRDMDGHAVTARAIVRDEETAGCHVLFVSGSGDRFSLVQRVADQPVMTVGDGPDFARQGGALRVFFEQSRLKFEINTTTVERTRLRLSSKMLGLARLVRTGNEI